MTKTPTDFPWRCTACGTLIGVERGGKIHLKYKKAQFVVQGSVLAVCRYCSELNERKTPLTARDGPTSPSPQPNKQASAS